MGIKFIIDSASDILPSEAEELGVIHLPLTVMFGDKTYRDAVDLTHEEFYEKLIESDTLPTTSQINPSGFEDAIKSVVESGDIAIIITVSGKLSGTYQSAMIAADEYEEKVFVIDSESVCVGERLLLYRGLELRYQGLSAAEIVNTLNKEKKKIRLLALLDTLEYLKKGGRISSAVAFAGNLLSIKPVVSLVEGEIVMLGKARGSKQGNNLLRDLTLRGNGIDFNMPYALAYSGLSDTLMKKYIADSAELYSAHTTELPITTVGCVIGTHAGPGAIAVAFFEK